MGRETLVSYRDMGTSIKNMLAFSQMGSADKYNPITQLSSAMR
jgi:hypothetical protein